MDGPNRIIIYNQSFMSKIANNTGTDWAGISILAHEIGHHLMQHTLGVGGGRSDQELAADQITSPLHPRGRLISYSSKRPQNKRKTTHRDRHWNHGKRDCVFWRPVHLRDTL
jgi:hypothetical protein